MAPGTQRRHTVLTSQVVPHSSPESDGSNQHQIGDGSMSMVFALKLMSRGKGRRREESRSKLILIQKWARSAAGKQKG
jgi:hypothetical protein